MKRSLWPAASLMILSLVVALGATAFADDDSFVGADAKDKKGGKQDPKKPAEAEKGGDEKPFDAVVKDMDVVTGMFTFYRKADENKTLMEITPEQLDKQFLFAASIDHSIGERGFYGAQQGPDFPFTFHRVGKSIQWIQQNTSFKAVPGTPEARAMARSFPNAILGSAKILSKPHADRKSVVIDVTELFGSRDLPGLASALGRAYTPTNFSFDKERSGVAGVRAFPENALIDVNLHYVTDNPRAFSITLADARSVPISLKYQISVLKETAYKPRVADDRVGHFHTIQQDLGSDHAMSPYVRYINRWSLEKSDPTAALSAPKEPIVFWLENTIPLEYRPAITEGTLLWNKAFEKLGFKDAVVVKQQPDSADWDPADTRYNTIRWFAGVDASFAIGPSRANPYTGQIYDADISISEGIIRNVRRVGEELVGAVGPASLEPSWMNEWGRDPRMMCDYADGLVQQAAFGMAVIQARGMLTPEMETKLMREYILELTAHEVGHTLGLRHNFRASTILTADELNDVARTHDVSQSSSVMDYNPIVIARKGQTQGDFLPITLGPYDYWAIEYAYKPIEGDENAALKTIASRAASDKMLPYSTDEDALGTYSPASIDPLANQYDQSTDPLVYFGDRLAIVNELWATMETNLAIPGEGYQIMRRALGRGVNEYNRSLLTSSKLVGGVHHRRDHVGDPGARSPYTPVPAAKQREALDFLATWAFSPKAFQVSPSVLNKLAIERLPTLDAATYYGAARLDYPWHDVVLRIQSGVLDRLYHPITLGRVLDNELRFATTEKPFKMVDLFSGLNTAIWAELDSGDREITSLRRNLQRAQLNHLIRLTLREETAAFSMFGGNPVPTRVPEDATTLARSSLVRIQTKIRTRLAGKTALEATTRAHLQETQARIDAALAAQMAKKLN